MRATDERGIALVAALGMMFVLSLALVAALEYASSNQRSAKFSSASQAAFDLAEAGMQRGASVLYNSLDPAVPSALGTATVSENGGTSTYSASLSGQIWTITGTGTMPNPTGGGTVTRTVSQQYRVTTSETPWEYNFSDAPTGCLTLANNAVIASPLWVRANLCMSNNSSYTASKLYVGGTATIGNGASIGTSTTPVTSATIVGGCTGGSPNPHPCTTSDRVYATSYSQTPQNLTKPPADLDYWYQNAKPGPMNACTVGSMPGGFDTDGVRNNSRPLFDLTPGSAYDCRVTDASGNIVGRLTWTPGTSTLLIAGVVYFDGSVWTSGNAVYQGRGTIYASGTVNLANSATLCGISGCTDSWDSTANQMMLVAGSSTATPGFSLSNGAIYQGFGYAVTDYLLSNNAQNWGPVIARQFTIMNNAGRNILPPTLTPGAPGVTETIKPVDGSYSG